MVARPLKSLKSISTLQGTESSSRLESIMYKKRISDLVFGHHSIF